MSKQVMLQAARGALALALLGVAVVGLLPGWCVRPIAGGRPGPPHSGRAGPRTAHIRHPALPVVSQRGHRPEIGVRPGAGGGDRGARRGGHRGRCPDDRRARARACRHRRPSRGGDGRYRRDRSFLRHPRRLAAPACRGGGARHHLRIRRLARVQREREQEHRHGPRAARGPRQSAREHRSRACERSGDPLGCVEGRHREGGVRARGQCVGRPRPVDVESAGRRRPGADGGVGARRAGRPDTGRRSAGSRRAVGGRHRGHGRRAAHLERDRRVARRAPGVERRLRRPHQRAQVVCRFRGRPRGGAEQRGRDAPRPLDHAQGRRGPRRLA